MSQVINSYKKFKGIVDIDNSTDEIKGLSKNLNMLKIILYSFDEEYGSELRLRFVTIYFHATTFDRITKDRAAKFVDMLSAIGGTMGLLTGFSIISGVEIVYFGMKIILKMLADKLNKRKKKQTN